MKEGHHGDSCREAHSSDAGGRSASSAIHSERNAKPRRSVHRFVFQRFFLHSANTSTSLSRDSRASAYQEGAVCMARVIGSSRKSREAALHTRFFSTERGKTRPHCRGYRASCTYIRAAPRICSRRRSKRCFSLARLGLSPTITLYATHRPLPLPNTHTHTHQEPSPTAQKPQTKRDTDTPTRQESERHSPTKVSTRVPCR